MTVFKAFFLIIKKYKGTVILYTALLIGFSIFNMSSNESSMTFTPNKPDIYIVNCDKGGKLSTNLISYLKKNCHLVSLKNDEEKIDDAVFYRDVNYVVYIPKHYSQDVLSGKEPEIQIKSTGDYQASLAQMILKRYIKVQKTFVTYFDDEMQIIDYINQTLKTDIAVKVKSKVDTSKTSKATFYFNFASYSIMACIMYIVCLILSSFNQEVIKKRTTISSLNYKTYNRQLLLASFVYSLFLWLIYVIAAILIIGNSLFDIRGLFYIMNAFIFTFCSLTLALMISSLVTDKNA
ncbi:MAG: ABC transporter permease, partial [Faecalibacillus sp.]